MTNKLDQLCQEISRRLTELRRDESSEKTVDSKVISSLLNHSRDCFDETRQTQEKLLHQLQCVDESLADLNKILRLNARERNQLEQSHDDVDRRAQLMALNAEALECRAAAVQLQQQAQWILNKALEMEKQAAEQLAREMLEAETKTPPFEENSISDFKPEVQIVESSTSVNNEKTPVESAEVLPVPTKIHPNEDEFNNWPIREFMAENQLPSCILRISTRSQSMPVEINVVPVVETENLLEDQEELIAPPVHIDFDSEKNDQAFMIAAIPYSVKRTNYRENVIKIRQSNGQWSPVETNESFFESHKEKRFVQCRVYESSKCAVVSRLKYDQVLIEKKSNGRYCSSADGRFTIQWSDQVVQNNLSIGARLHPVDLPVFNQFCRDYFSECQGFLAVGPIIELIFEDVALLKPIHLTFPILVPPKKKSSTPSNNAQSSNAASSQDQQRSIFQSMLTEEGTGEQFVLLYAGSNDSMWHVDKEVRLKESKNRDMVSTEIQSLHNRMIVARYDRRSLSTKQIQQNVALLDQILHQRSMISILRRQIQNPSLLCFICCSNETRPLVDQDLQAENYAIDDQQVKEIFVQEGQLLEIRFRGNVQPVDPQQRSVSFVFNTHFPFYYETLVQEVDRYAQHLSPHFYGFLQIFDRTINEQLTLKDVDRKKSANESIAENCLTEFVFQIPKINYETRIPTQKILLPFTGEGILTPALFRDLSTSLSGDDWRRLGRRLGITAVRLESIEHDHQEDAAYYMLLTWFKRVSRASDKVLILINALRLINRKDLASDLQSIKEDKRYEHANVSKEEQMRVLSIAFTRLCQREECVRIWKQISRELSLTNENIMDIERQYNNRHERCLRALEQWSNNEPRADVLCLAKIIRTLGFKTLARELEDMV